MTNHREASGFRPLGRKPKYDWNKWANGEKHTVVEGVDFQSTYNSFQVMLHTVARKRGLKCTTQSVAPLTMEFQFYDPEVHPDGPDINPSDKYYVAPTRKDRWGVSGAPDFTDVTDPTVEDGMFDAPAGARLGPPVSEEETKAKYDKMWQEELAFRKAHPDEWPEYAGEPEGSALGQVADGLEETPEPKGDTDH